MNKETIEFFATARERYRILVNKRIGHKPYFMKEGRPLDRSYTDDPIFQTYRFCNVFREDDKVTEWFREQVRTPLARAFPRNHLVQVRAAVAFRWFNLPFTGELLMPWLFGHEGIADAERRVGERQAKGKTILNAAYMIKSPPGVSKTIGLFNCLRVVEDALEGLTSDIVVGRSLERAVNALVRFPYLGPFMAYQSVCDLRFTTVLENATDINEWTSPGPGSARGISRLLYAGDPTHFRYSSAVDRPQLIEQMRVLLALSHNPDLWPANWPKWELSTVQHWACEYDKYMRVKRGEGEPKQRYTATS